MRKIAISCAMALFCGPASAQSAVSVPCINCTSSSGPVYISSGNVIAPPPQDLIVNSRNEGLVLIRKLQDCRAVADKLRESPDVTKAECKP